MQTTYFSFNLQQQQQQQQEHQRQQQQQHQRQQQPLPQVGSKMTQDRFMLAQVGSMTPKMAPRARGQRPRGWGVASLKYISYPYVTACKARQLPAHQKG